MLKYNNHFSFHSIAHLYVSIKTTTIEIVQRKSMSYCSMGSNEKTYPSRMITRFTMTESREIHMRSWCDPMESVYQTPRGPHYAYSLFSAWKE